MNPSETRPKSYRLRSLKVINRAGITILRFTFPK